MIGTKTLIFYSIGAIMAGILIGAGFYITLSMLMFRIQLFQGIIIMLVLLTVGAITGSIPHIYQDYCERKETDGILFRDYLAEMIGDEE